MNHTYDIIINSKHLIHHIIQVKCIDKDNHASPIKLVATGIPPQDQCLFCLGKDLCDHHTLARCGIMKESVWTLVPRLRGGMEASTSAQGGSDNEAFVYG